MKDREAGRWQGGLTLVLGHREILGRRGQGRVSAFRPEPGRGEDGRGRMSVDAGPREAGASTINAEIR